MAGNPVLEFYSALSRRLYGYRLILWILAASAALAFICAVFWAEPPNGETYALSAILLLLWTLSLVVVVRAFASPARELDSTAGLFVRMQIRISRGYRWFMAVAATALFCFVILLSFKSLGLILRG